MRPKKHQQSQSADVRCGIGQLSLVEHALCPLDPAKSLRPQLIHECRYRYSDKSRRRRVDRCELRVHWAFLPKMSSTSGGSWR